MKNLELATTENFGAVTCDFYRNIENQIFMTREQIGDALGYHNPSTAIKNIHRKHRERLDDLSLKLKFNKGGIQNEPSFRGGSQETYFYSQRGIMEICRWSKQPKANLFMDWVWDIIEKYRNKEFEAYKQSQLNDKLVDANAIDNINNTLSFMNINNTLSFMNDRLDKLEEIQFKKQLPEKKYSRWKTKTFNKLNTLLSYVNENSDESFRLSDIIHLVIEETEDTYNIEVSDYTNAYKSEFGLESNPYVMDVINYYKDIRDVFTQTLNSIMEKLHIEEKNDKQKRNIFDELSIMV